MKRRERKKQKPGAPAWMVTFSDMIQLILVFFIMLFAMSQVDAQKFQAISDSFRNRTIFDFLPSAVPMDNPTDSPAHKEKGAEENEFDLPIDDPAEESDEDEEEEKDSLGELMEDVEHFLEEHGLTNVISATRTERGVVLILPENILFNSGEAEIIESAKPFLTEVGTLLSEIPNAVKVEGHADNRPISNYRYPSNWELSGARSSSVIRYLIDEYNISPTRLSGSIYAETRPIVPNTSPTNLGQNRRVEIIILEEQAELEE